MEMENHLINLWGGVKNYSLATAAQRHKFRPRSSKYARYAVSDLDFDTFEAKAAGETSGEKTAPSAGPPSQARMPEEIDEEVTNEMTEERFEEIAEILLAHDVE